MTPIIELVAPRLVKPALMVGAAIIVKGYTDVGDGFSAAVIVALAVAIRYVVLGPALAEQTMPWARNAGGIAAAGLLIALAAGFFGVLLGRPPFTHWPPPGEAVQKIGTLELTTAFAFDVGLFVLVTGMLVLMIGRLSWFARGDEG
jgi:multisubunit Na+/H+ antiporter MnhB subunit